MNTLDQDVSATHGTSAMGSLFPREAVMVILVTGAIGIPSTSSSREDRLIGDVAALTANATSAGGAMVASTEVCAPEEAEATAQAISSLRRVSGLTWEQVGRLFDVSRRSVHFWASGKPMSADHEEHLRRVLALVRGHDASPQKVRGALLSMFDGAQVLELLSSRQFENAQTALTMSLGTPRGPIGTTPRTPLSEAATSARRPLPPEMLAQPEDDATPAVSGRGRSVRTSRSRDRGRS